MKKLSVLMLAILMSVAVMLTSCDIPFLGGGETTEEITESTSPATDETTEAPTTEEEVTTEAPTTAAPDEDENDAPANTDTDAPADTDSNTNAPADTSTPADTDTDTSAPEDTNVPNSGLEQGGANTEGGWGQIITPSR